MTPSTAERQTVTLRNYYPRTIRLDADSEPVPIRIRRFTPDQLLEFQQGWALIENPPSERDIYQKDGEQDVPITEVRRRRLVEMTPEQRAAFEAMEAAEAKGAVEFCCEQIRQHVSVDPAVRLVVEDEAGDPRPIKSGADLVAAFAGNRAVLLELAGAIAFENTLSAEKKRAWRARFDSSSSSTPVPPATTGTAPAATAAPVAPSSSASDAGASAPSDPIPFSVTA
jgi:DNA-binding MarR family transcriptional regulator